MLSDNQLVHETAIEYGLNCISYYDILSDDSSAMDINYCGFSVHFLM